MGTDAVSWIKILDLKPSKYMLKFRVAVLLDVSRTELEVGAARRGSKTRSDGTVSTLRRS